jgi:hypothetical protein
VSVQASDAVATSPTGTVSGRARAVLGRLPRHLLAGERGKLVGDVVEALGGDLDVQTLQLGQVRRAHAFGDAEQDRDVLLLAGMHGLRAERVELLRLRLGTVTRVTEVRALVAELVRRHREGSGTVGAILGAAAAYLGLAVDSITDADARFWHLAACRDRLGAEDAPGDLLALEENPGQEQRRDPIERWHGQTWEDERGGFEGDDDGRAEVKALEGDAGVTISVKALDGVTLERPMVVARDIGVAFFLDIWLQGGQEVRFNSDGSVTLDGQPLKSDAAVLHGAFFADAKADNRNDAGFAKDESSEGAARFVERRAGPPLPWAPRMDVGTARFAFFVDNPPEQPKSMIAQIGLAWQERRLFAVRLWIPARFRQLDVAGRTTVAERLRLLLDRHRAAGVELDVAYSDSDRNVCKYPDLESVPPVDAPPTT